jgi:hypothetical protein
LETASLPERERLPAGRYPRAYSAAMQRIGTVSSRAKIRSR